MEMKKVNILWTGGLDSSCRIIELSRMNVVIIYGIPLAALSNRK